MDDSLTVRELERKMIEGQGYAVDVAVDGMDASVVRASCGALRTARPTVRAQTFASSCDKFISTEVLRAEMTLAEPTKLPAAVPQPATKAASKVVKATAETPDPAPATPAPAQPQPVAKLAFPLALLRQAIEEGSDENGWTFLGVVGTYLTKIKPDFDPRLYGHKKLSDLLKQEPKHFVVEARGLPGASAKSVFVKLAA